MNEELGVVWLEPIGSLAYVRSSTVLSRARVGKPRWTGSGRLVGYTTLAPGARGTGWGFWRTVFYLRDDDPVQGPQPTEAVDPQTIKPWKPTCGFGP